MRKIRVVSIWLIPVMLAIMSCSHAPQTYPPPNASIPEQPSPVMQISPIDKAPPLQQAIQVEGRQEIQETVTENQKPSNQEQKKPTIQDETVVPQPEVVEEQKPTLQDETVMHQPKKVYDIPCKPDQKIDEWVKRLLGKDRSFFVTSLDRFDKVRPTMERIFQEHGLPKDLVYVALVESAGNPNAVSHSGATGYWQFLSGTARLYGLKIDRWVDERRDLEKSTHAAAEYLNHLHAIFDDWPLACAAYNAGEGAIIRLLDRHNHVNSFWDISRGMMYKNETLSFVPKIMATIKVCKNREKYGLKASENAFSPTYDVVKVKSFTTFERIADITGYSVAAIAVLNPELRQKCTPPSVREYRLKIPKGTGDLVASALSKNQDLNTQYASHAVQKGDTLYSIARQHHTTPERIAEFNKLLRKDKLALDRVLIIPEDIYLKPAEKHTYVAVQGEKYIKSDQDQNLSVDKRDNLEELYAISRGDVKEPLKKSHASAKIKQKPRQIRYYVKKGDTIWSISRQFAVSPKDIMRWNRTTSQIHPGEKLTIYTKKS